MSRWGVGAAILAASAAFAASPASAVVNPRYFAEARAAASDVVVIAVDKVRTPFGFRGRCRVEGRIVTVERGRRYAPGQPIRLEVACGRGVGLLPLQGTNVAHSIAALKQARGGRAYLGPDGAILQSQYQTLEPHTATWADKGQ